MLKHMRGIPYSWNYSRKRIDGVVVQGTERRFAEPKATGSNPVGTTNPRAWGNVLLPEGPPAPNGRGSEPSHIYYQTLTSGIYTHVPDHIRSPAHSRKLNEAGGTSPHTLVDILGNPYTMVI